PYHRILPTRLGAFDVRLTWRDLDQDWPPKLKLGGVLFPGVKFTKHVSDDSFLITGVICESQNSQVTAHLEAPHTEQCAAAVFPELTIDPVAREKLRKYLQERAVWALERPRSCPSLVVAGSWHEANGKGNHVNVATVFDAYGEQVLRHEKLLPFRD